MKIKKVKGCLVLEPFTSNDCFTCGVIVATRGVVSVDLADHGLQSIRITDDQVLMALCGDRHYLASGTVLTTKKKS